MSNTQSAPTFSVNASGRMLRWAGAAWFLVAATGQAAFIYFILAYYGSRTLAGQYERWNDKGLITGHVAGDAAGNAMFAAHVLLASVVTLAGLMQLIPALRRRFPGLHRWTGRSFLVIACFMALSGVWLAVVRGSYLSLVSAIAISINAVLILVFAALAWRDALKRRFESHRLWAMRTFMVVSGVWFLRVGIMGWILINRGPVGMTNTMSGPTDVVLTFGSYLIPLAVLELYLSAQRSDRPAPKILAAAVVGLATLFTAAGVFGTITLMWLPEL